MATGFTTMAEVLAAARSNLTPAQWDDLVGGAESETTLRRNRLGFDALAFHQRVPVRDAEIDASTSLLGHRLRIPVLLAPIGSVHRLTADGSLALARGAGSFGTMAFVSTASKPGFDGVGRDVAGPKILHLALREGLDWCADTLRRARDSGYVAVNVTVGSPRLGRIERPTTAGAAKPKDDPFRSGLTWDDLDRIRDLADLPIIAKGITTPDDARIAVDRGIEVVCISNHGGRTLDHGQSVVELLPGIVEAVDGRAAVLLDGGVLRGTDVVKAVALGARAVMIGKLHGAGLAAGGSDGLVAMLEILEDEILTCLELLGVATLDDLGPERLRVAMPVRVPSELGGLSLGGLSLDGGDPGRASTGTGAGGVQADATGVGAAEAAGPGDATVAELPTNADVVRAARSRLPDAAWDRLFGAAESETTMLRNRLALDRIALRPRVLVGVTEIATSTTLLGEPLRLPIVLANLGVPTFLGHGGEAAVREAAMVAGTIAFLTAGSPPAAGAAADPPRTGPWVVELSARDTPRGAWGELAGARDRGAVGVAVGLVSHAAGRRERRPRGRRALPRRSHDAWGVLADIAALTDLPLIAKGVMDPDDARRAVDLGCAAIYVSNAGGRTLDHGEATVDVLADVVAAIDGRAEVIVDGGFMRGTDVVKALALGASAVAVGRLQGIGLAADGAVGLAKALENLGEELRLTMALLGVTTVAALGPDHLVPGALPVQLPHETSAFFRTPVAAHPADRPADDGPGMP